MTIKDRIKEILETEVWTTATIKAGIDKGSIEIRKKSIDNAVDRLEHNFMIVDKGQITTLLDLIVEYVTKKVFDVNVPVKEYTPPVETPSFPNSEKTPEQMEFGGDFGDK